MWKGIVVRRRRLGRTSVREISQLSKTGIVGWRTDLPRSEGPFDIAIRWGCTEHVPERRVLNTSAAIHRVNDKSGFRDALNEFGLCPRTWFTLQDFVFADSTQVHGAYKTLNAPVIVRPQHHAQGRDLFLCNTLPDVEHVFRPGYYISEVFPKTHEFRVCFVQGRVAWVASKTPGNPDDIAWNVARGGHFDNVRWDDWPLKCVKVAHEAFSLSGLDFGGVDVMWNEKTKEAKVLEINSAPSLTSPYRQECMARCFDYIMNNESKDPIDVVKEKGGYRKFIHPALCDNAIVP